MDRSADGRMREICGGRKKIATIDLMTECVLSYISVHKSRAKQINKLTDNTNLYWLKDEHVHSGRRTSSPVAVAVEVVVAVSVVMGKVWAFG